MNNNLEIWKLGVNETEAEYLFDLVKQGVKTAISYLYDETFVAPAKYTFLTNWEETEKITLETTKFYVVTFDEVAKEQALKEGEGLRTTEE